MRLFFAIILIIVSFIQFVFFGFALNLGGHVSIQESSSFDYGIIMLYMIAILVIVMTSLSKETYSLLVNGVVAGVLFFGLLVYFSYVSRQAIQFFSLNLILILGILVTNLIYFFNKNK
ncbi:hypothetical protein [Bernardetia sp.]|uniref:hypothetical protein n=1 Tax=Bernardetia sp. TaxID=1937974 RepID=UPI0025BD1358|nr:hypothetical protein [Bernardetia sp.]